MSGLDELDDALAAAEAELERARVALREAREAQAGARLEALAKELTHTQERTAELEQQNARAQAELDALGERATALRQRLETEEA